MAGVAFAVDDDEVALEWVRFAFSSFALAAAVEESCSLGALPAWLANRHLAEGVAEACVRAGAGPTAAALAMSAARGQS